MIHKLQFDIITLFPAMFNGPLSESIIKRAQTDNLIQINLHQLRDYAYDKHKKVDDTPYGGGPGMVLRVDVVDAAISNVKPLDGFDISTGLSAGKLTAGRLSAGSQNSKLRSPRTILLTPTGKKFDQKKAIELSKYKNLILICGHYEGFDQRIHDHLVDEEISIGDYVLTGGELPAMVMIDAISRMVPGVIKAESVESESFMPKAQETSGKKQDANKHQVQKNNLITKQFDNKTNNHYDFPVYTKPVEYKRWKVPEVLISGDHEKIDRWREKRKNNKKK